MLNTRPWVQWAILLLVGAYLERRALIGAKLDHTYSHFVRLVFRTHTRPGRVFFLLTYGGFSSWFIPHILKRAKKVL